MTSIARLIGVSYAYGSHRALDAVDIDVQRGEVLAVLGPNGAGKTTAISILLGLLRPDHGHAEVFGKSPHSLPVRVRRGAMLQSSGIPGTLRVREHLELFRSYYPRPLPEQRLIAAAGLEDIASKRFDALSGGQKQRVLFALALAGDPELVFLDEPTTGLDIDARRRLWAEIRRLREDGRTAVLTTHYLEEADALADRVIVIANGQIVAEGTPAAIKSRAAGRIVRCVTALDDAVIAALPGVVSLDRSGNRAELLCSQPEAVLRELLRLDPQLTDLEVRGVDLETAFLSLTRKKEAA